MYESYDRVERAGWCGDGPAFGTLQRVLPFAFPVRFFLGLEVPRPDL